MQLNAGKINGLKPKFNIYTVPGQAYYKATRQLVLVGVDGIVFVADSQEDRMKDNLESFNDLKMYLKDMGKDFESIPVILQCNKQDLPAAFKPEVIQKHLSANGITSLPATATEGKGVFETLSDIIIKVGKKLEL